MGTSQESISEATAAALARPYVESLRAAEAAVAHEFPRLVGDVLDGALGEGTWHPNGFATFQRYFKSGLGLVRLHVWPQGLRRAVPGHPEIHSHGFHVYSRVVAGIYIEDLHSMSSAAAAEGLGDSQVYEVDVLGLGQPDVLVDTGLSVEVALLRRLCVPTGSWHDVAAGALHRTVIPEDSLCATLCVLGEHRPGVKTHLVGAGGFDVSPRMRPLLTENERDLVLAQLRAAGLSRPKG